MILMTMETPFSRSYWVVPGKFLAGYYPGDRRMEVVRKRMSALLACGIRCIINLMEPDERDHDGLPFVDYEPVLRELAGSALPVVCYRMPILDLGTPSREYMIRILDRIDDAIKQDNPVYVHCWGGRGRTGMVVGCWLVRHGIAEGREALEMIRGMRRFDPRSHRPSPEMPGQIKMVVSWKKGQ